MIEETGKPVNKQINEWIPPTLALNKLPHTEERIQGRVGVGESISGGRKSDAPAVHRILRRTHQAKRSKKCDPTWASVMVAGLESSMQQQSSV